MCVAAERCSPAPLLPPGLLRHRAIAVGQLVNVAVYGLLFVFSLFFQRSQGRSALETGAAFRPMAVSVGIANFMAARIPRAQLTGALAVAAGAAALLHTTDGTSLAAIAVRLAVFGAGVGLIVPTMTGDLPSTVTPGQAGVASARSTPPVRPAARSAWPSSAGSPFPPRLGWPPRSA